MVRSWESRFLFLSLIVFAALAAVMTTPSCRRHAQLVDHESEEELTGEPEQYSATVVRTVDDGTKREVGITRHARSGEKRREEWIERGHNRALIWRPDLGKSFLLDLDRRVYVELEIVPRNRRESQSQTDDLESGSSARHAGGTDSGRGLVEAIDRAFDDTPSPISLQTRALQGVVIDGHPCKVYERRATFEDGHAEVTRSFRARDLAGLALRIEAGSESGPTRATTERRDVSVEVAPDAFDVPADFKKVETLAP